MESLTLLTFDNFIQFLISIYLVIYTIWAISIVTWYNRRMQQIELNHKIEMKKIADQFEERMNCIREDYKKSILKYNLMRTIAQ